MLGEFWSWSAAVNDGKNIMAASFTSNLIYRLCDRTKALKLEAAVVALKLKAEGAIEDDAFNSQTQRIHDVNKY